MNLAESLHVETTSELKESRRMLSKLVEQYVKLDEGRVSGRAALGRALVKEAIIFERLTILEAAGQSPEQMAEMMSGMLMSAKKLAARIMADGLTMRLDTLRTPDEEELDAMSIRKDKLAEFRKNFVHVAAVTKGLMAIADDISNMRGGEGGELAEVLKTLMAAGGVGAEGTLSDALFAYDNATAPMKKPGWMKGKPVSMQKKFANAVATILKSKAPGAVKFLDPGDLVASMMKVPLKQLVRSFGAYNGMVTHFVDNDFLMKMTKQPMGLMGALKGAANAFMGSGMAPSGRR